jgi:hypothetical protein
MIPGLTVLAVIVVGAITALAYSELNRRRAERRARERRSEELRRRQLAEQQRRAHLKQRFKLTLDQLADAPDFSRAANWASHAKPFLTAEECLRHFSAYRQTMIDRYRSSLERGYAQQALDDSLRRLLGVLRIPAFEADYIRVQAVRGVRQPESQENQFQRQLQRMQQEHAQRIAAIRSLRHLDPDTREQLLEAEQTRFRTEPLGDQI